MSQDLQTEWEDLVDLCGSEEEAKDALNDAMADEDNRKDDDD